MNNLMYLATTEIDYNRLGGVPKKVLNQFSIFKEKFNATLVHYGKEGIVISNDSSKHIVPYNREHRKYQIFKIASQVCKENRCKYVYIRYPRAEASFLQLLKEFKNMGCKVIIEIPTYPYNLEKPQANYIKETILRILDRHYRKQLKNYVHRIVTYSTDKEIWGIKTINTMNGIVYKNNPVRKCNAHEGISLVSCAYYYDCHGCERVIDGLHEYYENNGKENIIFHIVGDGRTIPLYKQKTKEYKLEEHVIFHGFCTGNKLERIYDSADIGVNSLAIHRLGLKTESTLKTKEYAAKGLPILSSYPVDALSEEDNEKYVCLVPPDDSPIDIEEIVKFYHKLYGGTVEELANSIRSASAPRCDMKITLEPIINEFLCG